LRPSWARHQIRVNTIVPGWIDTPMTEVALHGEAFMGPASTTSGDTFAIDGGYVIL
jgi:NAD(P)-dependent dehydrogenase (short-subunit alcohol dehydrogenase family)